VMTIRNVRVQLEDRLNAAPASDSARLGALARTLTDRLGAIEGELYQVRNRSFQDPLNFPPKLVERISALSSVVGGIDAPPTAQSRDVFQMFAPEIQKQLVALNEVLTRDLRAVNAAFRGAGAATIVPKAAELRRPAPRPTHGHTVMEIAWTLAPAVILVFVAVPTVRVIFATSGEAPADALKVDVIGHQWWWEFRYPELALVTANELHLPRGRPV